MKHLELKKNFYWNGILDPNLRVFDIIMETEFGTTYNSYVLKGSEKTALFETAKEIWFDQYKESIESIVPISQIDYIVVNHTEPDHAGSVMKLLELNPKIHVVGSTGAIQFLHEIMNRDFNFIVVKENDTLSLGDKTLQFMMLPNLHWPDTMYTYVIEDKTLITCDSFGSHFSHEGILRSTVTNEEGYYSALKYYFDNILGPFENPFMLKALKRIEGLDFDMICPGHGPVLDSHIDEVLKRYESWSDVKNPNTKKTVVIPYVSAYGYTKELATYIKAGVEVAGDLDVKLFDMVEADVATVMNEINHADGILFGSPTILNDALKPIWDLTTNMYSPIHKGKHASAFGSYGWSGEAVPNLIERLKQLKLKVSDGYRIRFRASEEQQKEAFEFGRQFGLKVLS